MQRLQKSITAAIILSETTHVFCCVLPTLVSVMSLLAGIGITSFMPASLAALHDALHHWEVPMILTSGIILCMGWGLQLLSQQIDCRTDVGCAHAPCAPKKNRTHRLLMLATLLFAVNVTVYTVFHHGVAPVDTAATTHDHH